MVAGVALRTNRGQRRSERVTAVVAVVDGTVDVEEQSLDGDVGRRQRQHLKIKIS